MARVNLLNELERGWNKLRLSRSEQRFDALGLGLGFIVAKFNRRHEPKAQFFAEF
jgi:hypothetical protein